MIAAAQVGPVRVRLLRALRALAAAHPGARSSDGHAVHTMTGAYACDALTAAERCAVESHLRDCVACTDEVAAFTAVAARLAGAVARDAPATLYPTVVSEIARSRRPRGLRRRTLGTRHSP